MKKAPLVTLALAGGLVFSTSSSALAASSTDLINYGEQFLGKPYVFGARIDDLNEFDCSSFTATVFEHIGVSLPRTALSQSEVGTPVDKSNLQIGDLVFFDTEFNGIIDHVGIYVGQGQMINAILTGVETVNMNTSYWTSRYVTARRVLNSSSNTTTMEQPLTSQNSGTSTNQLNTTNRQSTNTSSPVQQTQTPSKEQTNAQINQKPVQQQTQTSQTNQSETQDTTPSAQRQTEPLATNSTSNATYQNAKTTYTVQSGDSLWLIANNNGLSVSQLKSMNQLKNDLIFSGQQLIVSQTTQKDTPSSQPNQLKNVSQTKATTRSSKSIGTSSTQSQAVKLQSQNTTYTIQNGDTLSEIAYKKGTSVTSLITLNQLTSSIIYPGQKIKLSKSQTSNPSTTTSTKVTNNNKIQITKSVYYTVQKGDTLWDIGLLNNTNSKAIMKANKLPSPYIFPGQELLIPRIETL